MKETDRYLKIVEWSDEDGCYVGTCPSLMHGGIHGDDEAKVYKELCQAVEEWTAILKKDGHPLPPATAGRRYSGKFLLRIGEDLHKALAIHALKEGESLNSYCAHMLRDALNGEPAPATQIRAHSRKVGNRIGPSEAAVVGVTV